jgi:hypothetical protein
LLRSTAQQRTSVPMARYHWLDGRLACESRGFRSEYGAEVFARSRRTAKPLRPLRSKRRRKLAAIPWLSVGPHATRSECARGSEIAACTTSFDGRQEGGRLRIPRRTRKLVPG